MLSTDDLEFIRSACAKLEKDGRTAFAVAAVHRILPVYQAYSEIHTEIQGYDPSHDTLVQISRLLRRRPGVTSELVERKIERAKSDLSADLSSVREVRESSLAESLVEEVLGAIYIVLDGWGKADLESYVQASLMALEVDLVWAEGGSDPVVSWDGLNTQYSWQVRDLKELALGGEESGFGVYRTIAMRAEREGVAYLQRMRSLMGQG